MGLRLSQGGAVFVSLCYGTLHLAIKPADSKEADFTNPICPRLAGDAQKTSGNPGSQCQVPLCRLCRGYVQPLSLVSRRPIGGDDSQSVSCGDKLLGGTGDRTSFYHLHLPTQQ